MVLLWVQHLWYEAMMLAMLLEGLHRVFLDANAFAAPRYLACPRSKSGGRCYAPGEAKPRSFTRCYVSNEAQSPQRDAFDLHVRL